MKTLQNKENHIGETPTINIFHKMKDFRINSQNDTIGSILEALETCSQGIGMKVKYDHTIDIGDLSSTIIFKIKPGYSHNPIDFFWLGFFCR